MATLHIIEGAKAGYDGNGPLAVHSFPASGIPHATLSTSGTSASHTFDAKETLVTLICTGDVHIKLGTGTVTATTSDLYLPGFTYFSFELDYDLDNETMKLAAIDAA